MPGITGGYRGKMNIAAYCRVSTEKDDQLNSLEAQKKFFADYTARTGDKLVRLYADEGISGTKIKNRKEFLSMMKDAELGIFDLVVVKDISRFARNTVDLLQNIRKLKSLGIETQFLTANMTSMGNSEFVLTIFGALAQEESANTSKRVKFGKKINAEKGKVPNIVFGYDKIQGDYFNLRINDREAETIKKIYDLYINDGCGASKIAGILNENGIKTKRNCRWSQNAVCRILTNELYTGKVINGKEEVADFLTGRRTERAETEWMVTEKPELRIIETQIYKQAQRIMKERSERFKTESTRQSNRHLFSTLIKCSECGRSFRRSVRKYRNTYIKWVCSDHNGNGADSCPNAVTIDEEELIEILQNYFAKLLSEKKNIIKYVADEFQKGYRSREDNICQERELKAQIARIETMRKKYLDLYAEDIITRDEMNAKIGNSKKELERLSEALKTVSGHTVGRQQLERILNGVFREIADISDIRNMTNAQLKKIVRRIDVDANGNVDVYLQMFEGMNLDRNVPVIDDRT